MALTPIMMSGTGRITNAAATYYTTPANSIVYVTRGVITNTDTATRLVTIYVVRSGGSTTDAELLVDARPVGASKSLPVPELAGLVLEDGDLIRAFADATNVVNFTLSGLQTQ